LTTKNDRQIPPPGRDAEVAYGSNDIRLSGRQWLVVAAVAGVVLAALPTAWERIERIAPADDYRVPYPLSEDYWLFDRLCRRARRRGQVLVLGDSVVWGHYVTNDRTLPAALNARLGRQRFANLGVDGIHPAALTGLIEHYGRGADGAKVLLHANLLWMSSDRHDLRTRKAFAFNHPQLVPQFSPAIPCYRETVTNRLAIAIRRRSALHAWASHLRRAYFDGRDLPAWSLDHPYANPLGQIALVIPAGRAAAAPTDQAVAWTRRGIRPLNAPWVPLDLSFQWARFRRAVEVLRERGCELFVVVGPFNEPMLTGESLAAYRRLTGAAAAWLRARGVPCTVPRALPSEYYADASHPLADGYATLAERLLAEESFARFADVGPTEGAMP